MSSNFAYLAIIPSAALVRLLIDLPAPEHFRTPALYLTAAEDAVVDAQGGKEELAANYEGQPLAASWIDVADTGHMSFADDCGLAESVSPAACHQHRARHESQATTACSS